MNNIVNYWFTIEPYVFVMLKEHRVLLYNTLDGNTIESEVREVIDMLHEILLVENCGVLFLEGERYNHTDIFQFVQELREKYMGDIFDVNLSKSKPIQLLPYYNFQDKTGLYKKHNFSSLENILDKLSEIRIYIDDRTNINQLVWFLDSIPGDYIFEIIANIELLSTYTPLLFFLNQKTSLKNLSCSYKHMAILPSGFRNNFAYKISVQFPIEEIDWNYAISLLANHSVPVEFIFEVSSNEDYLQAERLIRDCEIKHYYFKPLYTGDNLQFFEDEVFLTREDILGSQLRLKDFFIKQALNVFDFGKINVLSNGDVYANVHHPSLGNIFDDSIYDIVNKEISTGVSWLRIRDQEPCNHCIYQWLCPPPSCYEIVLNRPNLCHVCYENVK